MIVQNRLLAPDRHSNSKRKFFKIGPDLRGRGLAGMKLLNKDVLVKSGKLVILGPDPGTRGFPAYPELPHFLFDRKLGRAVGDIELCVYYWLISDRMKGILEGIDPDGFAFVRCNVELANGQEGPIYWLCDVIRVLDALNEEKSTITIIYDENGNKIHYRGVGINSVFRKDVVESAHVFRIELFQSIVLCDEVTKIACNDAQLRGVRFKQVGTD
jgi:hypothetical protein